MELCLLPDDWGSPQSTFPLLCRLSTRRPDPTAGLVFQSGHLGDAHPRSWMNLWVPTRTFLPASSLRTPCTRRRFHCRAGALHPAFCVAPPLPSNPKGTVPLFLPLTLFNMIGDTTLSTSSPSIDPLRPCILALRGGLRPRELPLCSLKPP